MLVSQLVKIGAASAVMSFALSVLIVWSQKWHGKLSHDHDMDGVQKFHATAVPRIGGIAVIAGILMGIFSFAYMYPGEIKASQLTRILILLAVSLPAFVAGITEDMTKRVSVKVRLVATVCSALLASLFLGATVNELDIWGIDRLLALAPIAILVTAVVVAGGANAINIIDGFNGLSGSVIVIMAAALGVVAWQVGDGFVAILSVLCVGSTIGFLLINYPSGRLFLGDGGAYFCGFWVSEIAVLLLVRNTSVNAWQVLSICAFPIIEVLFSMYRRKVIKNSSVGAPDALHLHTLIYRRVVSRFVTHNPAQPWTRNAAVAFVMVPWIGMASLISVVAGGTVVGGLTIVVGQVILYIAIYGRLVRGRWTSRRVGSLVLREESIAKAPRGAEIVPFPSDRAPMARVRRKSGTLEN
jgi:UDP-N-acetylmuramyl pentapeptide phosphotransferase/UDP-N-acetylglucosamine-1-phosphate transferase